MAEPYSEGGNTDWILAGAIFMVVALIILGVAFVTGLMPAPT